ncbi:MAG: penicillin-binding protein 2 [Pseudomonadota bacterium]
MSRGDQLCGEPVASKRFVVLQSFGVLFKAGMKLILRTPTRLLDVAARVLPRRQSAKPSSYVMFDAGPTSDITIDRVRARGRRRRAIGFAQRRLVLCGAAFAIVFASLGVRLWTVSLDPTLKNRRLADAAASAGPRAEITDRNGVLIAANLPMRGVAIVGAHVWDADETARALGRVMPSVDVVDVAERLRRKRYVPLNDDLTPAQAAAVFELGLPGVDIVDRLKRYYPQGALAAHLVGQTAPGRGGLFGLEKVLDDVVDGAKRRGGSAEPLAASIDLGVQQALEEALGGARALFSADAAWGGVMDVATGELIALASLPDYDPNAPANRDEFAVRNRAVYDRYELGSVFKAFTAAAALEAGVAQEETLYDARRPLQVADRAIRDYHGKNRILSFTEVIQYSSNIGAAMMAADLGAARQRESLRALGLFEKPGIELIERRAPDLPAKWGPVEAATVSYGHGIAVSPLHALAAFSTVVNGGVFREPTIVRVDDPDAVDGRRVFSERVSAVMRRALRRVVAAGTARQADAPGYFVIGKTGTAEKPDNGVYAKNARINTFVGAFPGHRPRYAVLVSLDNPKGIKATYGRAEAGWNAAPLFATVVQRIAPLLHVAPAVSDYDEGLEAMLFSSAGSSPSSTTPRFAAAAGASAGAADRLTDGVSLGVSGGEMGER